MRNNGGRLYDEKRSGLNWRRVGGVVAVVTFILLSTTLARANIIPQRGLDGTTLDMSLYDVEDQLGRPDSVGYPRNYYTGGKWRELIYGRTRFWANYDDEQHLVLMETTDPAERTAHGVGVGSTERAVLRTVRGIKCRTYKGYGRTCILGGSHPGRKYTEFRINRKGRVKHVYIGITLD